ncbi:DUF983 domain-containing protein [Henriciella sp.]|uniref:DUF983 domain-containing protein n=1 Tax=Henriciella sp. TaxID=1968823 RepID=UPI002622A07D|nr:DUF983 domain-containing protein [Henriciella sp.]
MFSQPAAELSLATALRRGLSLRCPRCGEGKLLIGYLRQAPACSHCGLETGAIRADDGPPWLTLLATGHLLAPFMIIVFMSTKLPVWASTMVMALVAASLCVALLPRAKGLFIAAIWKLGAQTSASPDETG